MSIKQYRFVSPGVQVREIDNSQLPREPETIGPLVIGRAERGVSMRPVQLESFSEFIEVFGNPVPGGLGGDIWRDGNRTSPMYGGYAAQAFLANQTPLTYLRLLGYNHPDRISGSAEAGWTSETAYGLFVAPLHTGSTTDAALAAIVYVPDDAKMDGLVGENVAGTSVTGEVDKWVASQGNDFEFVLQVDGKKYPFNFARTSKKFVRRVLNTNPTLTNDAVTTAANVQDYWLGETYEAHLEAIMPKPDPGALPPVLDPSVAGNAVAALVKLDDASGTEGRFDKSDLQLEAQPPTTSWVISQHTETHDLMTFNDESQEVEGTTKLFRLKGLNDGEWASKALKVGIQDIKASEDEFNPYGTFTIVIRVTSDSDNAPEYVERYALCNLDPNSVNYVARKIGDMDSIWDYAESRYRMTGQHPNLSRFVRVEMDEDVDAGVIDAQLLPFGFYGPAQPRPDLVTSAPGGTAGVATDDDGETSAGLTTGVAGVLIAGDMDYGVGTPTFRFNWPATACRTASTVGNLSNGRRSFFGVTSNQSNGVKDDPSYGEFTRPYSSTLNDGGGIIDQAMPQLKSDGAFAGDAFTQLVDLTLTWTDTASAGVGFPLPTQNPTDGNTVVIGVGSPATNTIFTFKNTPAGANDVQIGADLGDTLQNLVDVINTVLSADVLASLEAQDNSPDGPTSSYIVCLKGLSEDACDGLVLDGSSSITPTAGLALADDENACVSNDVKIAAGDYFGNGIVPYFSLDDLVLQDVQNGGLTLKSQQHVDWLPGARYAGASVTVRGTDQDAYDSIPCGPPGLGDKPGTYRDILEFGYDQFTLPLVGGFDGLDITEQDPFRNTLLTDKNELTHYAFNSIKRGIDTVADPEVLDMNLACVPGITNPALTTHLTEVCRDRGDCLAIIDLQDDYVPRHEGVAAGSEADRLPNPKIAVQTLKDRRINNSYGTAYFPWVQARDNISNAVLWMPPSVAALGTMAYSETRPGSELWFAPAGFNRGGLTDGAAGIPVTNVRYRLTSKERDLLYEANINPIASFPSEGIVVFGNKTLQVTPSALDRVNVRRLMIYLKKEVSRISNQILFDQNVTDTWNRFLSKVNPLLASVQSRFGLTEFKVVLDETTTTPDLIDRNILYAKIFLKPARAIEFIAVDFNISRTGASFTD
jgi:hypothetical protein